MWLEALRSGEYQQGRSYLKKDNKYCCLGVLAEKMGVLDKDGLCFGESGTLDGWIDQGTCPLREGDRGIVSMNCLAGHNDLGKTFEEIADIIEQNADKL